jgi:lipooligosaccharide transport system permease protein
VTALLPELRIVPPALVLGRRASRLYERNVTVYRSSWLILASGLFEPLFYLWSIGIGIGKLVGSVPIGAHAVQYTSFVAPALLASSAMNGAIYDSTFNVFFKMKYMKVYDAVLATPLGVRDIAVGEVAWSLTRGLVYAAAFLVVMAVMGLAHSWTTILALPVAILLGFAFAALGMAATSFMRSWQDFEFIQLIVLPMFLFSATFYPLSAYPGGLRYVVEATPLYQGVALVRACTLGELHPALLWHVLYLVVAGAVGVVVSSRRLGRRLLR